MFYFSYFFFAKGLSTRKFAHEADIFASKLGRLQARESDPSLTTLLKIAKALKVKRDELIP